MKLFNLLLLVSTVHAFSPPVVSVVSSNSISLSKSTCTSISLSKISKITQITQITRTMANGDGDSDTTSSNSNSAAGNTLAELQSKVNDLVSNFDIDINTDSFDLDAIKSNVFDGDLGNRGEIYAISQLLILGCILGGGIPVIGNAVMILLGPGLLLAGAGVMVVGSSNLGANQLSPWPVPPSGASLQTTGLYAEMRHPMYAGLLAACAGLSIVSGSATRLLLTAVLFYGLEIKSSYEEEQLLDAFGGDYAMYQSTVTSKFFPESIANELPWMKKELKQLE